MGTHYRVSGSLIRQEIVAGAAAETDIRVGNLTLVDKIISVLECASDGRVSDRTADARFSRVDRIRLGIDTAGSRLVVTWSQA
ncbi:MAG TPA: hypothetical protein VGQ64_07910 [Candidatus Limnocylindrales bacterium]|jgi:predicted amino acid racemase|nr:hypothetical protein [Candidatus Limnocylindrales bacterium]